jgi:hypothetical protein
MLQRYTFFCLEHRPGAERRIRPGACHRPAGAGCSAGQRGYFRPSECLPPAARFTADGDYPVRHIVRTSDGREASVEYTITVRPHDVAITSASFPKTANSGQTKIITVSVKPSYSSEYVTVQLMKSIPGGMAHVGEITQWVPLKPGGRALRAKQFRLP